MYERFKSQLILKLSERFDNDEINTIINIVNIVANDYEFNEKSKELVVYENYMPEVIKTFLACKKIEGYSDGTLNNYKNQLMNFVVFINKDINDIQTNDIRIFLYQYQMQRNVSNRTLNKYQENLKAFFVWCHEEGYIDRNIARKLKPIKYEEKPRQALSQIELEQVRCACKSIRDRAIVEFIYSTGCRVSELCDVKISDVDWNNNSVHLFGKGSKHRTSFINAKSEFTLKQYLDTRNDNNEYLFVSLKKPYNKLNKCGVEKIIRDIAARSELNKKLTPHILRHTTATTALRNGMPVDEIQKMLGHSSVNTTMIYAKTNIENVKANHKRFVI